jgi:uncharacterized protein (DUF885 family)
MNSITELSDRFLDELAGIDPVRAAFMGVARDSTRITDWSPEGVGKIADLMRRTIEVLDTLAPVDDAERLGAGYLLDTAQAELRMIESGERERRMSNEIGPPSMLLAVFDVMPRESPDDWERIAERMADVPDALDGYVTSLRAGLEHDRVSSVRLVRAFERRVQCHRRRLRRRRRTDGQTPHAGETG